jgi:hypothetical protein
MEKGQAGRHETYQSKALEKLKEQLFRYAAAKTRPDPLDEKH